MCVGDNVPMQLGLGLRTKSKKPKMCSTIASNDVIFHSHKDPFFNRKSEPTFLARFRFKYVNAVGLDRFYSPGLEARIVWDLARKLALNVFVGSYTYLPITTKNIVIVLWP